MAGNETEARAEMTTHEPLTKRADEMPTESYEIRNRYTGAVQFSAEIECAPDAPSSTKLGLAVRVALKADADLSSANLARADLVRANLARANLAFADLAGANLADADLAGANLAFANLAGADLAGARLVGARLVGARLVGARLVGARLVGARLVGADLAGAKGLTDDTLRSFKADMWMTLARAHHEVPALIAALEAGRVDGSQYKGACACLVGTLANAVGTNYDAVFPDASASNPAEQWFSMICEGDKPGDDSAGGFAATWALKWAKEFDALVNGATHQSQQVQA
jgi:uncharacterized protein YjbI with pentapeptide repeats